MKFLRPFLYVVAAVLLLVAVGVTWLYNVRPGLDAYAAHHYVAPPDSTSSRLTATWLGNTALLLRDGEHAIMVDPFFTRPPGLLPVLRNGKIAPDEHLIADWLRQLKVDHLDAVLVSHSHYDHGMDAGVVARLTGAILLGSESTANIGRGSGVDESHIHVVSGGDTLQFGSFGITFIPSVHAGATGGRPTGDITSPLVPPARYTDYRQGGTWSILIDHAEGSLLHNGSAGFIPGALAGRRADVVFLGIAIRPKLADYLANVVDSVGAKRVIPMHWDDFTRPLDQPLLPFPVGINLDGFFRDMDRDRADLQVQTLKVGEAVPLFAAAP